MVVKMLIRFAWFSFWHRRKTLSLIIFSLMVSLIMLLSLNTLQAELKRSFNNSISTTDLIVGARGGSLNLLLYSIFHIGDSMQPIDWRSYSKIQHDKKVSWAIPLTLGDSHRGHRVVGTTEDFFKYYRYGERRSLVMQYGRSFESSSQYSDNQFEVVIGAHVARTLGYSIGASVVVSHGLAAVSFNNHQQDPLRVVGILEMTGTPVDQALYVSVQALELLHDNRDYSIGDELPIPSKVSSVLLGLESRLSIFSLQKKINEFRGEPLQAILPGVTLTELWTLLGHVEKILWVMAGLLLFSSLLAMITVLLASMQERQRELAIVRVLGGGLYTITALLLFEIFIVVLFSSLLALIGTQLLISVSQSLWMDYLGFPISGSVFNTKSLLLMAIFGSAALVVTLIPAVLASRRSLSAGLVLRQ
tara:strand:- start:567 stop:1820 length:1254 start_codon:yes stop_codon:yes gene_type:complete